MQLISLIDDSTIKDVVKQDDWSRYVKRFKNQNCWSSMVFLRLGKV
ncbi:hypothetical protein [Flavobacterium gilvum]